MIIFLSKSDIFIYNYDNLSYLWLTHAKEGKMYEVEKLIDLSLLHVGHVFLNKNWDYDDIISPFSRLYYIASGSGKIFHHGQEFQLKPGHLYLVPSFTYSRYICDHSLEQYYVHFLDGVGEGLSMYHLRSFSYEEIGSEWEESLFKKLIALNPEQHLLRYHPKNYDNEEVLRQTKNQIKGLPLKVKLQNQGILLTLLANFMKDKQDSSRVEGGSSYPKLFRIFDYIQQNLSQKLTIPDLAAYSNLSPDHFSRRFRQHTGYSPSDYIQLKRIERAQLLLTTTDNSLSQISFMVGITNYSHFIRIFQKFTATTPAKYRKEFGYAKPDLRGG